MAILILHQSIMDRYRILICLALCVLSQVAPTHGQIQMDTNVLARLDNLEKEVKGHTIQLDVQSKLIAELQAKVTNQESTIVQHQITIGEQQTVIDAQHETILKQQKDISNQRSTISKHHRQLSRLETILIVGKESKGNQTDDMAGTSIDQREHFSDESSSTHGAPSEAVIDSAHHDNDITRSSKRRLVIGTEGPVAFHAVNTGGRIDHVGSGQNIMFPTVMINQGAGYHNQHGVFIAPAAGLYMFSTSILSSNAASHPEIQVDMKKNGVVLGRAYAHGDSGRYDQGSITIVTQLAIGDEVWVSETSIADASYWGGSFTSFMGYLLWPL